MTSDRKDPACLTVLTALVLAAVGLAPGAEAAWADSAKPAPVTTVGPRVLLSAAHRAALAAKRAATVIPPIVAPAPQVKAAPISTIPGGVPSMSFKVNQVAPQLTAGPEHATLVQTPAQRALHEASRAALIRTLGSEMARRAGLVKVGVDETKPEQGDRPGATR